jgi:lysozyme
MSLAAAFIKRFEGYARRLPDDRCVPYLCSAKVLTIGYGSTGEGVRPGAVWTRGQADARFQKDLAKFAAGVFALSPGLRDATEGQQAAIISFAYNLGLGAYKNSTLRRVVNREDWPEAQRQLMRWTRAGGKVVRGLVIRRQAEAALIDS